MTVDGTYDPRFESLRELLEQTLDSGEDLGASIALDVDGELLVDIEFLHEEDADRCRFELAQRFADQQLGALLAAARDARAPKQDHRGRQFLGRGDDRPGVVAVERADQRIESRLHIVEHHSTPRVWNSIIALAMIAGWTP